MGNNYSIRIAELTDAKAILDIYSPFILMTAATFEEVVPSLEEFEQRTVSILADCPFLVCEINGRIAGYAYAGIYRSRAAYRWNREVSVYVHPNFRRMNVARALYQALFPILKLQGFAKLFAVITIPNEASVAFHESFGFTKFCEYKNVGYKLGKWHDVGWWEMNLLDVFEGVPRSPIPFAKLKLEQKVGEFLKKAEQYLKI